MEQLNKYLDEIGREQLLTAEEEQRLSELIRKGDERALNRLIEANLRFVVTIARQYQGKVSLTVLNGTTKPAVMKVARYQEVIGSATRVRDVLTGRYYDLSSDLSLKPRQSLVLSW